MKMYIALAGFILVSLFAFVACSTKGDDYKEEQMKGGKVDNSYEAPTTIESRNIESFETYFYLWDEFDDTNTGGYSFVIKQNETGEYVLSENSHYNISEKVDKSILEKLQVIIEDNNLVRANGIDKYTQGLPEEFAPCMLSVIYDSGEKLYFSEDNNPQAKWARDMIELFKNEFISLGHEELLPPIEDRTLVRFDMSFVDGPRKYMYATIFTEEDIGDYSVHYIKNVYNRETKESEFDEIIEVPEDFYEKLSEKLTETGLENYQNGTIESAGTSKMDKYASFTMEMQSGLQKNAFYEGDEAEALLKEMGKLAEYIDVYFE